MIVCAASIGLSEEERKIPDIAFSASSFKSATFAARYGRLNLKAGNGHDGSWCTKFKDQEQYIQVCYTNNNNSNNKEKIG